MASLGDTLEEYGQIIVKQLQDKIAEKKLIASADLVQSLDFRVKIFGKDYVLWVGFNPPGDKYAPAMDSGRRKGTGKDAAVPIQPIIEWMRRKGIKSKKLREGKGLLRKLKNKTVKKGLAEKMQESMAWAIAKKIQRDGLGKGKGPKEHPNSYNTRFNGKPSKFWAEVINDDLKKELTADLRKALKRDILIEFGELKKEIKSHG
jgi:hypothetical protein